MKKILLSILVAALVFPIAWDMGEVVAASKASRKLVATEGQRFTVSGSKTVRFGTATRWVEKKVSGSGICSVRFFGRDPAPYQFKTCTVKKSSKKKSGGSSGGSGGGGSSKKTLTINTLGTGTVTSAPAGINCGPTCTAQFSSSQTVTLSAVASSGFIFTGWSGPCTGTGTCSVKVSSNRIVGATFRPVVNGSCGSANGGSFASAPDRELCSAGAPSAVDLRDNQYGWTCAGSQGGTTAECRAEKTIVPATALSLTGPTTLITGAVSSSFTVSGNGTFTSDTTVTPVSNDGGTFTPSTLVLSQTDPTGTFRFTVASAGAKTITLLNNRSLTNPAGWSVTVTDPPLDGTCGSAEGQALFVAPAANLCSAGTASSVATNASTYTWTCAGANGGLTAGCTATRLIAPTATVSASPTTITSGQTSTITWSSTNATSCTASNGWSGTKASSGTQAVSPTSSTTYALTCTGPGGTTTVQSATVTVTAAPINGSCGTSQGGSSTTPPSANLCSAGTASSVTTNASTYTWSCSGANGGTTAACTSTRLIPVNGTCGTSNGGSFSTAPAANLCSSGSATSVATNASTYTWTCAGANGGLTAGCTATRLIAPTATVSASPTTITSGQTSTITWSSTNATSCTASNGWSGTKASSGTQAVSPTSSTTYALTCTGTGGTSPTQSVVVTVNPAPTNGTCGSSNNQSFTNAPSTNLCVAGSASTVATNASTYTWSCTGANGGTTASCSATRLIPVNGSCGSSNGGSSSTPPVTNLCSTGSASTVTTNASTYTWDCAGSNGGTTAACTATRLIAPTATVSASPTTITSGQTSTITWSSTNATSCTMSNGTQSADSGTSGSSATPALTTTTTYTFSCTGAGGTANSSVTVTVSGTPTPQNGACGTSNGSSFSTAPTTNLCTTGTASSVITNTSTYTWSCTGSNGGTTASCSATRTTPAATALTLSGPTSGTINQASTNFTVSTNGSLSGSLTITPSSNGGGGTFNPTTLTLNATTTTATFTYTPTSTGQKTISITNSGSLANPGGIGYGVTAGGPAFATFTLTSPMTNTAAPFTLGHAFKQGDVPSGSGVAVSGATAQVTPKTTWPDGSLKTAVIAGVTDVVANTAKTISLHVGTAIPGTALGTSDLQATGLTASIGAGSFGTASWSASDWTAPFESWVAGPQMSSWIYRKPIGSDAHLVAWLEVRLYASGAVEVLPWIENGYLKVASPTSKSATYAFTLGGTQRFSQVIDLPAHTRTPLVSGTALSYWLGSDPAITPRHDVNYLMATKLVPKYSAVVPNTAASVTSLPSSYTPLQQGSYPSVMGTAGYHASIGLLPEWDVLYLTSSAASVYGAVERNAYSAGRYGIYFRDEATNRPVRFSQHPTLVLDGSSGVSDSGASTANNYTTAQTGTAPARYAVSHSPALGYMAALLSGRYYHLETTQFQAAANYLKNTDSAAWRNGSQGLLRSNAGALTTRGSAWALRTLAMAAALTPSSSPLASEFIASVEANIGHYHARYVAQANNPYGFVTPYSDYTAGLGDNQYFEAAWMQDFVTAAWGLMRSLGLPLNSTRSNELTSFFNWKAKSIIGRLGTSATTEYLYRDAAAYTVSVAPSESPNFETGSGPWHAHWGEIWTATGVQNSFSGLPRTDGDLRGGNFPDGTSYWGNLQPAIAYAVDFNVTGASAAYARMTSAANWSQLRDSFNTDPVWSVVPASGVSSGTATALTLSGPTSGTISQASTNFTVSTNGSLSGSLTITPSSNGGGGTFNPTTLTLNATTTTATFTYTPTSTGQKTISITNSGSLANPASVTYTANAAPVQSTGVKQFLTHDGDMVGDLDNSSAPSRDYWNTVLRFKWKRGGWGDWMDATQRQFGESTTGAVPYASFAVPQPGAYTANVTTLVSRWLTTGQNRGFYLRMKNNAWPVRFAGRTDATVSRRPMLTIVTSNGTFDIGARANATWNMSTYSIRSRSDQFELSGQQPAILHFSLDGVTGTVQSATLKVTDIAHDGGASGTGGTVEVYEADPPQFVVPNQVANPELGFASSLPNFQAIANHPDALFSDDFATPGPLDSGWISTPQRVLNPNTNTTYARGSLLQGNNESYSNKRLAMKGAGGEGGQGMDVQRDELYSQYHIYFEDDYGSNTDGIKIPAMGGQFGYWRTYNGGYWQMTTGNGGYPGTGLKVYNAAQNRYEYEGHSVRMVTSLRPADNSLYADLHALNLYPYNLDQDGPFPAFEQFPYVAVQKNNWYAIDLYMKQNSMSGARDAQGNYANANPDGVYKVWINGYPSFVKSDFRWRKHPEFGVEGLWLDVYHGGVQPAPYDMHYRLDRVSLAKSYIGPQSSELGGGGGTPTPQNGACGTSNGSSFSTAPTTNLCTTGTASSVITNTSTYTWSCTGSNGGTTASCSATRTTPAATALTLSGPTSGTINQASTNFTVSTNGSLSGSLTITPSSNGGGGTFNPTTLTLNATTTTATFTYTPTSTGQKTISITNSGSLANPGGIGYVVSSGASYTLPNPGQAVAIGSNTAMDVVPTSEGWTQAAWEYSLFNSYGGGQFTPAYSARGAYVLAGTGGHNHPDNTGAAVFDFSTGVWSRLDNANGVARKAASPWAFSLADSNGSPYYEATGTQVPLPPHPYANLTYLPIGSKGSVAYVTRGGAASESRVSGASHRFDLASLTWSRLTDAVSTRADYESDSVYDAGRNRVWIIPQAAHNYRDVQYLDLTDSTLKTTATMTDWPSSALGTGYNRAFMHGTYLMRSGSSGSSLWLFDPDAPSAGWIQVATSGTFPNSSNRWSQYSDGKYYAFDGGSASSTIVRITPPANAKTSTWVADTVTLSGATLPAKTGTTEHYTRFFYVPAIDSLAWIAGGTNQVVILKPPGTSTNGSCGSSNGSSFSTAPTTNLCATGTASSVTTNASTYTWNCSGSNGGTTASCSATRTTASLPSWIPAAGEVAVLTQSNGKITNQFESQVAPYYDPFHYVKTVNDYSGAFKNPYWGTYGATVFWGGGHAGTNDNTVTVAEYGQNAITFKRVSDPTPWTGSTATDAGNRGNNSVGDFNGTTLDLTYMEGSDGQPGAPHSYSSGDIIGPEHGGAQYGTLVQIAASAVNYRNDAGAIAAHKIDFDTTSLQKANGQNRKWTRITDNRGPGGFMGASPHYTAFVPAQNRIYYAASSGSATRWFDRTTNTYVTGTGTGFDFGPSDGFDSGIMFHVPSRNLLVAMYPQGGQLKVQWMDVSVNQPSVGGTATLSQNLAISDPWSAATWVPDNNRIVLAGVSGDSGAAYEIEIPATLTSQWTVTRAPFGSGQTFSPYDPTAGIGLTYKKFEYDAKVKSIVYMPKANRDGADETIWVYRPRGT